MMNALHMLPPSKTVHFKTPLYPNLVRTGVIGDGSCFMHAVCFSLYADYRDLTEDKQKVYVQQLRKTIAESISLEQYKSLGSGELFRLQFITAFRNVVWKLPIDKKKWDTHLLPELANRWKTTDYADLVAILQSSDIPPNQLHDLCLKIETPCWRAFQHHVQHAWVDEYCIEAMMDHVRCNVYFIDSATRGVYRTSTTREKFRKNVILLWLNQEHYESIAELYNENVARRVFTNRDKCILRLKSAFSEK